eukprot:TRINITY_DN68082_c1_g1_i19.p1 TRINITY_DN68082_c1_g1~~TRINITY_DN68082_c1_g1_i19.p1  ORF type:complete len:327 (-),score=59.18 TRINITY_DN68082_c1_g1_i19:685-1665(-)
MPTVQQYRYDQDAEQAVCDKPPDVTRTTKFQLMMFNGEAEQQNCGTPTECHSHGTTTTQAAALRRGTSARISHYSSSWGDDDDTDDSAWLDTVGTKIRRADAAEGGGWGDDIVDWDITNKTAADESHNSSDHGDDSVQYYTCSGSGSKRVHSSSNPAPDDDEPPNKKHKRSQDELLEARKCDEDQCEDVIRIHPHYPQHNPPNTQNVVEHTATKRFHMCECDDDAAPLRKKSKTSPTPDVKCFNHYQECWVELYQDKRGTLGYLYRYITYHAILTEQQCLDYDPDVDYDDGDHGELVPCVFGQEDGRLFDPSCDSGFTQCPKISVP